jgi:hypothetical protein
MFLRQVRQSRWPYFRAGRATDGTYLNRPAPAAKNLYVGLQRPCLGKAFAGMLGVMARAVLRLRRKTGVGFCRRQTCAGMLGAMARIGRLFCGFSNRHTTINEK